MKVQCENCGTSLNLPDDKLSPGHDFSFNCPKCKQKNTVHVPLDLASMADMGAVGEEEEETAAADFFEEGAKPALICFDEGPSRTNLQKIMTEMGYTPVVPQNARNALRRFRLTQYRAVLLHDSYSGQTKDNNAVLGIIQPLDMTIRRRMFVALFGRDFQSMDHLTAYSLSVNTVINLADESNFKKILHRGIAEYELFYKVYFDVMRELGKS
ncbi:MAG: hypothetical protein V1742_02995 [Pseudomonadota bacterium]